MEQQQDNMLKVRMLGDFALFYHGEQLKLERSNTTKAMQALQIMLYLAPEGVPRDKLLDMLYAQDSAADPANNLKVTISNLRRLLVRAGLPESVTIRYKNGSYFFVCDLDLKLDVREYERAVAAVKAARTEKEKLICAQDAISLYNSDFLPHLVGEDWVVMASAHYRQEYSDCVRVVADIMQSQGSWEALLPVVTRAAALYGAEEWQCLRIDCLMQLERWSEAKQVYEQAVQDLADNFDVKPSSAMVERLRKLSLAGQEKTQTVAQLTGELKEDTSARGPYYCSYPSFIDVYRMCCRMLERSGQSAYLLLYWLTDTHGRLLADPDKISAAAKKLGNAIGQSLRRGDAFTQNGRDRYLVLLIGTNRENCALVDGRIEKNYKKDSAWGVSMRHSLHLVGEIGEELKDIGWVASGN